MMNLIPLVSIVVMRLLLVIGCRLANRLMDWLVMTDMTMSGMSRSPSMSANISKLMCINHMLLVLYLVHWISKNPANIRKLFPIS